MRRAAVCILFILLLTGCGAKPYAHELEATMLVQVLGVDWAENEVVLTAACDPGAGSGEGAAVLSAKGRDFKEAKENLQAAGEEYVALTHVTQIVIGARSDPMAVLKAALTEPVLSQSATVWWVEHGEVEALLERTDGGAKRLSSIELNSGVEPVTVLQSRMRLEEWGRVELPVLGTEGDTLVWAGMREVTEGEREA